MWCSPGLFLCPYPRIFTLTLESFPCRIACPSDLLIGLSLCQAVCLKSVPEICVPEISVSGSCGWKSVEGNQRAGNLWKEISVPEISGRKARLDSVGSVGCVVPRFPARSLGRESTLVAFRSTSRGLRRAFLLRGVLDLAEKIRNLLKEVLQQSVEVKMWSVNCESQDMECNLWKEISLSEISVSGSCGRKARFDSVGSVGCVVPRFPARSLGRESTLVAFRSTSRGVHRAFLPWSVLDLAEKIRNLLKEVLQNEVLSVRVIRYGEIAPLQSFFPF